MAKKKRKQKRGKKSSRGFVLPLAIFLVALCVRLLHVYGMRSAPFFHFPVVDSATYDLQAAGIARGGWLGDQVFWQAPLYPYFLAVLYRIVGRDYVVVRLIQILLGSLSCVLLYALARGILGRRTAIVSGFAMALYSTLVFFDAELLAPVILVFLSILLLYLMTRHWTKAGWWFLSGSVLGVLATGHGLALLFGPAALVWIVLRLKRSVPMKKMVLVCVLFTVGASVPVFAVTLRNYVVGREFVLISSNAGLNFYIGNNPNYDHVVGLRPGLDWERLNREPLDLGLDKHSERSAFFFGKAFTYISSEPGEWSGILLKKLYRFFNGNEVGRNQQIYPFRSYSLPLRVLLWKYKLAFPFGLLAPLGIVGIFVAWRERAPTGLLALFLVTTVVSVTAFFVCARYRITAVPVLILFAAFLSVWVLANVTAGKTRKVIAPVLSSAALGVLLNLNTGGMSSVFDAADYFALGSSASLNGAREEAEVYYTEALTLEPGYPDALYNLGNMYLGRGEYRKAIEHYRKAADSEPQFPEALYNMAGAYTGLAEYDSARAAYRQALELRPGLIEAMIALGDVFLREDMPDSAAAVFQETLKRAPDNPVAHHDLAIAYYGMGMYDEAYDEILKARSLGMVPNPKLYLLLKELVE